MQTELAIDERGYRRFVKQGKMTWLVHRKICRLAHGPFPMHWDVHHIDGNKLHNRPENLIALPRGVYEKVHQMGVKNGKFPARYEIEKLLANCLSEKHRKKLEKRKKKKEKKQKRWETKKSRQKNHLACLEAKRQKTGRPKSKQQIRLERILGLTPEGTIALTKKELKKKKRWDKRKKRVEGTTSSLSHQHQKPKAPKYILRKASKATTQNRGETK